MSEGTSILAKAAHQRAKEVFASISGKIAAYLGSSWDIGRGNELMAQLREFVRVNASQLGRRKFALRLHPEDGAPGLESLTPQLIAKLRQQAGQSIPVIDVTLNLKARDVSFVQPNLGDDDRDVVTAASAGASVFFYEHERLCSIWADAKRVREMFPATWDNIGTSNLVARSAAECHEAVKDHYRIEVMYGQRLSHWADEKRRILKRGAPPNLPTTESIFHNSLLTWLEMTLSGANVTLGDPVKGRGDKPDIYVSDFGKFHLIEVKWLGTNGKSRLSDVAIKRGFKQAKRYAERSPCPEASHVVIYDGRSKATFDKFKERIVETGIAELEEFAGCVMPTNSTCYVFFLHSGTASTEK